MHKRRCPGCDVLVPDSYTKPIRAPEMPTFDDELNGYDDPGMAWFLGEISSASWKRFACAKCGYTDDLVEVSVGELLSKTEDAPSRSIYPAKKIPVTSATPLKISEKVKFGSHRIIAASKELAAVVGAEEQPRSKAVATFWKYVMDNRLIHSGNPNLILADANLLDAFLGYRKKRGLEMSDVPDFFWVNLKDAR